MKLTKRQYEHIADVISRFPANFGYRNTVAKDFAREFKKYNMNFDEKKFMAACRVTEGEEE